MLSPLLILPLIALGGCGIAAFGAALLLRKWVKAIETFFVRGGDAFCALAVWLGTAVLPLSIEQFAAVNVVAV